ncbi:hypothetical protein VQ326_002287 [Salmonella enterica]|nr:hypothetical protein [Salmonella enterica]EMD4608297.1 hypothetical protein [Salmonella enterica]
MILINTKQLGEPPVMDLSFLGGIFGGIPAGPMEECPDTNIALIGWSKLTPATRNHPDAVLGHGIIQSLDTLGAGLDGKRHLPVNTVMQEWIFQQALLIDGSMMTRQRINTQRWSAWVKRW